MDERRAALLYDDHRWGPVRLLEAASELTPSAFRVWVGLLELPDEELARGKRHIRHRLSVPRTTFAAALDELRRMRYVAVLQRLGQGCRNIIVVLRRAIVTQPRNFEDRSHFDDCGDDDPNESWVPFTEADHSWDRGVDDDPA
jgi:hypothetical protein